MNLNEVFSNTLVKVESCPEKGLVKLTWLQHTCGDPLRQTLENCLQYANKEGIYRWLFDMRCISYTTAADQSWTINTFFPAFDQWKRHKIACIVPPDRFDFLPDILIQNAIQEDFKLKDHFELLLFTDAEKAELWVSL